MKKIAWILFFLTSGRLVETTAQTMSAGKNAIMEKTPREAMTTVAGASHTTVQTAIQYFDGLGRPTQTVLYRANPDATKDIVASYTEYDGFGRPYKSLLPTPSDVMNGAYQTAPQTLAQSFYGGDTYPFKQSVFENSPLNRVVEEFGAGQAWRVAGAEKSAKIAYGAAGNEVKEFRMNTSGGVDVVGAYAASSLMVQTVTSERGFRTNEYKDRLGRVVAKSQELTKDEFAVTAYIYDDLNRLRVVIQPEAYKTVSTLSSFTLGSTVCKEGMFVYLYDSRGRVAEQRSPGSGITYMVYDKNDRVVMQADDQDKANNYWLFSQYDIFGRVIRTGLIRNIGSFTRSQIQTDFDSYTGQPYETRTTTVPSGTAGLYTNASFPSSYTPAEVNTRTITYYDDYDWQTDVNYNFQTTQAFHTQANTKGLVTGTLVRNLETNDWYKFVNYYDYKARNIQTHAQNHVGGIDRMEYQYQFNGEVLKMRTTHKKTGVVDLMELYEYSYDHVGRKTSFTHNNKVISKYEYDNIGRLSGKKSSPAGTTQISSKTGNWTDTNTWLSGILPLANDNVTINTGQTVTIPNGEIASAGTLNDNGTLKNFGTLNIGKYSTSDLYSQSFSYHIRGSLLGINLDNAGNLTNSIFSFKLGYETDGYFDGNIGKQEWKSNLDNISRSYTYTYDNSSRVTQGTYAGAGTENYSLNSVTYDDNGNIKTLSRSGWKTNNTFGVVDNLVYTYQINSNKIQEVTDNSSETASFKDVAGPTDYIYGADGSLISDANKGITVEYNYLKRPKKITFSNNQTIEYQYDANGIKIREKDKSGVWTDYVGNKVYKNNVLYQIDIGEGRINAQNEYEYAIQDHLGNVRVMFRDSLGVAKITQTENFGVWGESLSKINYYRTASNKQQFVYTGHERNDELGGFDAKARIFDPLLGRMWQIDLLADKFRRYSPYSYSIGNPMKFIDPTGMEVESIDGGVRFTGDDAGEAFSILTGRKRNVMIDITDNKDAAKATGRINYDYWAVFSVSNIGLAYEAINSFPKGSIKNLVLGSHGITVTDYATHKEMVDLRFKTDDIMGQGFLLKDITTYNKDGSVSGNKGENLGITVLKNILEKVEVGGNCIFAVCYLGTSQRNIGENFAAQLSKLTDNNLTLYTYTDGAAVWHYKDGEYKGAIGIGGDARLEAKGSPASARWNVIQGGAVINKISRIIISDSSNPVILKK